MENNKMGPPKDLKTTEDGFCGSCEYFEWNIEFSKYKYVCKRTHMKTAANGSCKKWHARIGTKKG